MEITSKKLKSFCRNRSGELKFSFRFFRKRRWEQKKKKSPFADGESLKKQPKVTHS
ncbi:hypothetical protein AB406_1672 [Riemerella anatipestifer]|uniref:Uncharacterized protein n=1 Tax=Riemerella anatipestifer TaxID=34085 RepID=A0A1S7DU25_RIEAN|nr:hypothetical protein AB406_1672 [Riemerella anatipestifer]